MAAGPGKYDGLCTYVREQTKAFGAAVMVWGGTEGFGFSVQAPIEVVKDLPRMLRSMADQIEKDNKGVHSPEGGN
jgi:hypothetical protein